MNQPTTWKDVMRVVIDTLPHTFGLSDVFAQRDYVLQNYADDRYIDEKLRLSLRMLSDQGALRPLGKGRYERTNAEPAFSPSFDPRLARGAARERRLLARTWVELNLYCLSCASGAVRRVADALADFDCTSCQARYAVHARQGRFGDSIPGPERAFVLQAIADGFMPDQILIEFDAYFKSVVVVRAIPGNLIGDDRIARRKGHSCTIHIAGLASLEIVRPSDLDHEAARSTWRTIAGDSLWAMVRRTVK